MAIYPGAVFKPTSFGGRTARNKQGRGILHVAVSGARSLPPWNGNTWHFYVASDGYCEQYVDTEFRAYAALAANDDAILIETQGGLGSSAVLNAEQWTPAAAARIADIMRWESQQAGGAPLELLPDSKPGRRGWGPHRLGIEHSRGVGAVAGWLVAGGERWSSAIGKECPGDAKVAQVPQIIEMARSGATGGDEFVMDAAAAKEFAELRRLAALAANVKIGAVAPGERTPAEAVAAVIGPQLQAMQTTIGALAEAVAKLQAGSGGAVDVKAIAEQLTVVPKD